VLAMMMLMIEAIIHVIRDCHQLVTDCVRLQLHTELAAAAASAAGWDAGGVGQVDKGQRTDR